jgi:hypothetical protein
MQKISTLPLLLLASLSLTQLIRAQTNTTKARSAPSSFSIKPKIEPPILALVEGSLSFLDANKNNALDANEQAYLVFQLKNTGYGDATGLTAQLELSGSKKGVILERKISLDKVPLGKTTSYKIPVSSNFTTERGSLTFTITVNEPNGFNPQPFSLTVETRAFQVPELAVADFTISGEGTIEPMKKLDLHLLLQNTGQGSAQQIKTKLSLPDNVVLLSGEELQQFQELKAGETITLKFSFIINARYTSPTLPIRLDISEKHGKYAQNWNESFTMNQQMAKPRELVVKANEEEAVSIQSASLRSDVDRNIPRSNLKFNNRYALVIGNEDYASRRRELSKSVNVDFAQNDAIVVAQYLEYAFGLPAENIKLLTDATSGEMRQGLSWIENIARAAGSETELFFFYSGHGLPSEADQTPFLMPVDISGDKPEMGISLKEVYEYLSRYPVSKITVVLDACFSGGARNEALIAKKGVRVKPRQDAIPDNMVVLASSSGSQSSAVYRDKMHGFLTYFLLKSIQQYGVYAVYGNLFEFVKKEVDIETARLGIVQQPQILSSPIMGENWKKWTIQ